ncbi:MAG: MFS transporter [Chloroflexi bacterium]|nr:MFS transporter [Chloroflexota bacterium]
MKQRALAPRGGFEAWLARNRGFIAMSVAMFVGSAGIGVVSPLLPVFAKNQGASGVWLGLTFSAFTITQTPLMPFIGRLSDFKGKKLFMVLGLLIYGFVGIGFAWSPTFYHLIFFRALAGIGTAMLFPIAFAYVGDLSPPNHEGRYMGLFNVSFFLGFGAGPLIGGTLKDRFNMDAAFLAMTAMSAIALLVLLLFLPKDTPERQHSEGDDEDEDGRRKHTPWAAMLKNTMLRALLLFQGIWGLNAGCVSAFIALYMVSGLGLSAAQAGLVLSIRTLINGGLQPYFGMLADRMNRVHLVSVGVGFSALGTFSIPWMGGFWPLVFLFASVAIFESAAIPAASAITVEQGRIFGMGSVMGIYNTASSLGMLVGTMTAGLVSDWLGVGYVFRYAAIMMIIGILLFNMLVRLGRRLPVPVAKRVPGEA